MKRPPALPVVVQVAALAVLAVMMAQGVALAVIAFAPPPPPAGFSVNDAARALRGETVRTADGLALQRRFADRPPEANPVGGALQRIIASSLANTLDASASDVVVRLHDLPQRFGAPGRPTVTFTTVQSSGQGADAQVPATPNPRPRIILPAEVAPISRPSDGAVVRFNTSPMGVLAPETLNFPAFTAAVRGSDNRWTIVEPPRPFLSPWQQRMLMALGISMLLLAPLVWWMARRLTRPIRVFADAAARLGDNPDADPLKPFGPTEVRTAIDAFNDMQASLRGHVRRRTQTVAAIAHDLRTPLTRLRFRAEQAPEAVRDRMNADIDEMDALIAQAMAYVRGDAPPERRERLDLAALVRDCAHGYVETGAAVEVWTPDDLPIDGDAPTLRRALTNLIDNALKYGERARVRTVAEHGMAVVLIDDDGPGLPQDELEAVFEPFRRGERSRNRETGGAGLGLTVARQAARAHRGEVRLINRADGLTARFAVPLAD